MFAILASRTGTDIDWDLRNYHAYSSHALLTGRFWTDVAPAQLQTYLSPVLDISIGAIRDRLNNHPVLLNIVLAMPHALAVWLAFKLTLRICPEEVPGRAPIAFAATLFSAAGAAGLPLLASSQDDMLVGSCVLGGLLLLAAEGNRPVASAAGAGLLFGVAAGLKLVAMVYCLAAIVALLLVPYRSLPRRLSCVAAFVLAGASSGALLLGPWCAVLFVRYRNPILPYMNQWFRSPFVDPLSFADERFKPHGVIHILAYPFFWAFRPTSLVSELPVRDAHFALAYVALFAILVCQIQRRCASATRPDRASLLLSVFFAAAFVLWELMFSILRYLATLELLTGTMALIALRPLLENSRARVPLAFVCAALGTVVVATTVYPNWGRLPSPRPVSVSMPQLGPGSLVILLDPSPMAYLANWVVATIPFVGVNNNLVKPGGRGLLAHQAEMMIRTHSGPLYGLEDPTEAPGVADQTLGYYGLTRSGCTQVVSNLDNNAIRLCQLQTVHSNPSR